MVRACHANRHGLECPIRGYTIANMSNNPADYYVDEVFIQGEQYNINQGQTFPNCHFGANYSDVTVCTWEV